jgi:hypothetical protein
VEEVESGRSPLSHQVSRAVHEWSRRAVAMHGGKDINGEGCERKDTRESRSKGTKTVNPLDMMSIIGSKGNLVLRGWTRTGWLNEV